MPRVFITRPIPKIGADLLRAKGYEVIVNDKAENRPATKEELLSGVKGADAVLSVLTDKIDGEVMDAGAGTLKIIANYAVGFDNIDLAATKKRGLAVTNTPDVLTNTVAEHTVALMLAIAHRVSEGDRFVRAGRYKAWGPNLLLGSDLFGKTLGIVGLGRIGSRVAHHAAKGFEMKVLYTDEKRNEKIEKECDAQHIESLEKMLPNCDFVSMHVPMSDSTQHLINDSRLRIMKRSAYLINTSRGSIVDEKALAKALTEKLIKGAAIDVFEFEPDIVPGLKDLDNIIMTPHTASATEETRNKMASVAAENIIEALEGRVPPNLVK